MAASKSVPTYEDILKHYRLSDSQMKVKCPDEVLRAVAKNMNRWRSIDLGLDKADVNGIENGPAMEDEGKRQKLLERWKERFGHEATYSCLARCFFQSRRADLVEEVCKEFKKVNKKICEDIIATVTVPANPGDSKPFVTQATADHPTIALRDASAVQTVDSSEPTPGPLSCTSTSEQEQYPGKESSHLVASLSASKSGVQPSESFTTSKMILEPITHLISMLMQSNVTVAKKKDKVSNLKKRQKEVEGFLSGKDEQIKQLENETEELAANLREEQERKEMAEEDLMKKQQKIDQLKDDIYQKEVELKQEKDDRQETCEQLKKAQADLKAEKNAVVPIMSGADIVAQVKLDITPGKPLTYHWEGHGFEIHIPADAISYDSGPVTLSIQASLTGSYRLPDDDNVFVSGVYWLALCPHVKFVNKVTVTIQHCGSKDADSTPLSFVKAKTQSTLPYIFKPLPGGSFSDSQKNGVIKIDHFCGIAVSGKQKSFYALCTYYLHKQLNVYETHFTVTPDLELQLKDVRDTYKNKETGPTEVAKINSHEISYEIQDPAGVGIPRRMWEKDGWELFPLKKATLQKEFLDHYEPGNVIPHFEISLKCRDAKQSLSQMVTFTGVESETFITILRHPALSEQGTSQTANNATGTSTATTDTGSLDINKDGCRVKELLEPLENYQLKRLFEELGLSDATLRNKYSHSTAAYLDDLVRGWIQGRDAVLDRGGATWESLKKALQRLGHNGIAAKITPSTADSSSITGRSMREDKSHGSSQSPDQSLQRTTSNTQLMTQDESHTCERKEMAEEDLMKKQQNIDQLKDDIYQKEVELKQEKDDRQETCEQLKKAQADLKAEKNEKKTLQKVLSAEFQSIQHLQEVVNRATKEVESTREERETMKNILLWTDKDIHDEEDELAMEEQQRKITNKVTYFLLGIIIVLIAILVIL